MLALLFMVVIWLPSMILIHGIDLKMVAVSAALSSVALLVFYLRPTSQAEQINAAESHPRVVGVDAPDHAGSPGRSQPPNSHRCVRAL